MKLYRGVSIKKCKEYKKKGVPKGTLFTTILKGARNKGKCVISLQPTKNKFKPDTKQNYVFKDLKIGERYYINKKPIKKFKVKIY